MFKPSSLLPGLKSAFFFSLFCCALSSVPLAAQGPPKTVLVTVSDTIEVPANHITVTISFQDTASVAEYDYPTREPKTEFITERDEVIRILEKNKATWKKPSEQFPLLGGMGHANGNADNEMVADFSSVEQKNNAMVVINTIPFVRAVELGSSVDKAQLDLTPLYAKLMKKARAKAEMLAKLSGKRVGEVYQIGSPFEMFSPDKMMENMLGGGDSGGGIFGSLMKMFGGMFAEKRPDYKVPVKETMTVSFYLLD